MNVDDESRAMATVVARLAERFPNIPQASIERAVHEERAALAGCRVREYIPVLVERAAKARLREAQASAPGPVAPV